MDVIKLTSLIFPDTNEAEEAINELEKQFAKKDISLNVAYYLGDKIVATYTNRFKWRRESKYKSTMKPLKDHLNKLTKEYSNEAFNYES